MLLHVEILCLLQQHFHAFLAQELDEGARLGQCPVRTQQRHACLTFFVAGVTFLKQLFGFRQILARELLLGVHQALHERLQLYVLLIFAVLTDGAGNNQRRSRIVNQNGVHLINHGEVRFALHHFLGRTHHIIPQIIEAEFIIRTVGNIAMVSIAALLRVRAVFVNTIDGEQQELHNRANPFRIPPREVVVHRHYVYALSAQAIEVSRQRSHEGFTFTGCHFSNFTAVQHHTPDQLHIVVQHIPGDVAAGSHPFVLPDGFVAFYFEVIFLRISGKLPVVIGGCNGNFFTFLEAARGFLHHGKRLRQDFL